MKIDNTRKYLFLLLVLGLGTTMVQAADAVGPDYLAFQNARGEAPWINASADHPLANTAFRPIPPLDSFPADSAKRDLGFSLFHDPLLSRNGTIGCNSCHMGMLGATDGRSVAQGINGAIGLRNTPSVFNSAFNFRQFWDGRAFDLDAQALAPITNPVEMGHDLNTVVELLKSNPGYASKFAEVYPDGVTAANLGNAIAQHSKDMTRTDSPFNAYLTDAMNPLDEQARRGLDRFTALGCTACHNGINLGGNSYQRLGNTEGVVAAIRASASTDEGLYRRTQREEDRQVFKVPSLHNVAMTAPYFHDGSVATLEQAVAQMAETQAGRSLEKEDVADIVAFLESLSSGFFAGMSGSMTSGQLQNEMRQQMPDMMRQQQQGGPMQGHEHQQHMMQMQQMQRMQQMHQTDQSDQSDHGDH